MRCAPFLMALAASVVLAEGSALAQATAPAGSATWSATDCQPCHEKAVGPTFMHTKHAGLEQSCARCHQNVDAHVQAPSAENAPSMKTLSAKQINETCLTCHEKANQTSWLTSMHARRNVACTDCHSIHDYRSVKAQLKTVRDLETCANCHQGVRAKMLRTSHHPVREGKMACASCHNPHEGARPKMLKADQVNELCYTCHTEKRGPFAFEHAPVREDCVTCHEPHGTNHPRLLQQKLPNLCWNCHLSGSGHFGSGDNLNTEEGVAVAPPSAASGYPTRGSRFLERSCRTCHIKIHGSNHPGGGNYFVR